MPDSPAPPEPPDKPSPEPPGAAEADPEGRPPEPEASAPDAVSARSEHASPGASPEDHGAEDTAPEPGRHRPRPKAPGRPHPPARTHPRHRPGSRRSALLVLGNGVLGAMVMYPFDGPVGGALRTVGRSLGGDLRRELETIQQFGDAVSMLLIAAVIWALDPDRRRRLVDLVAAAAVVGVVVQAGKMFIGRPRPRFDDPTTILGPFAAYPLGVGSDGQPGGVHRAWEVWAPISSDLWSMPSAHTAHAAVAAVFLAVLYPRLRPLAVVLVGIVALARVLTGAHWPSDVIAGGSIGWALTWLAVRRYWGVRSLDWLWQRLIDRRAGPAFPATHRSEVRRRAGHTPPGDP